MFYFGFPVILRTNNMFFLTGNDESEVSIYTNWKESAPPFGHYWFLIDKVLFHKTGIDFVVRVLRSKEEEIQRKTCPHCKERLDNQEAFSVSNLATSCQEQVSELFTPSSWWTSLKSYLTWSNVVKMAKFSFLLTMAAITGLMQFIQNMVPLLNRTLLALGSVVQQSMPFLLGCLDTLNKVIGATFLMLNRMWKDTVNKRPAEASRERLEDKSSRRQVNPSLGLPVPSYPYLRKDINRPYLKN